MPTQSGLLCAGDRIQNTNTGRVFEVVTRIGSGQTCRVIVKPTDGLGRHPGTNAAYGYPDDHGLIVGAGWWLSRVWRLVGERAKRDVHDLPDDFSRFRKTVCFDSQPALVAAVVYLTSCHSHNYMVDGSQQRLLCSQAAVDCLLEARLINDGAH